MYKININSEILAFVSFLFSVKLFLYYEKLARIEEGAFRRVKLSKLVL